MALSNPNCIFGIHSVTPYNLVTRIPFGPELRVLDGATLSLEGETIDLTGGSSKFPWKVGRGLISSEVALTFGEIPSYLFEILLGSIPTINAAEATGNVTTITNAAGVSLVDAVTGVASVGAIAASEGDLKFNTYVVEAATATTVDVYGLTDVDFARGTTGDFLDDTMKIATGLAITTSGTTAVTGFGVEFTGGSGTIGMTIGDTAVFEVRPINAGNYEVIVGSPANKFIDFGMLMAAEIVGSNQEVIIDAFRVTGAGMPIPLAANEFGKPEVTLKLQQDTCRGGVFKYRNLNDDVVCP